VNVLVRLTERQMRLLPILAEHYGLSSSTAVVRGAVDAMIAECSERDSLFAAKVLLADDRPRLPERVKPPALESA
jgi:hypothetical protein